MPDTNDLWYLRLPDGRVLRAAGAAVIRQQLTAGRLPPGTRARRSREEDWLAVERFAEFADASHPPAVNGVAAPATIASRLDPAQVGLAGVRPMAEELLGALDSAAVPRKLWAAALAGLLFGGLVAVGAYAEAEFGARVPGLPWALAAAALLAWAWLSVVLSRMTFTEVSRLRRARWRDAWEGGAGAVVHLFLAQGTVAAAAAGAILALRLLPGWLMSRAEGYADAFATLAQVATVLGMVLELFLWPLFVLMLPLGAVVVVERCSFVSALGQWVALLWRNAGRVLLAEAMALGIGLLISLPLALLGVVVVVRGDPSTAARVTGCLLAGLLSSLLLAYLVVANVFIYLNLRYEDRR